MISFKPFFHRCNKNLITICNGKDKKCEICGKIKLSFISDTYIVKNWKGRNKTKDKDWYKYV